jgi:hypothetical protein
MTVDVFWQRIESEIMDYGEKILEFEMYCDECGDCISAEGYDCRRKVINEWNRRYSNVRGGD